MNTGFLGPAVATVLTVYGIETLYHLPLCYAFGLPLQQCLPFTVLKLLRRLSLQLNLQDRCNSAYRLRY